MPETSNNSQEERVWLQENVFMVGNDDEYDLIETTGPYAGARGRIDPNYTLSTAGKAPMQYKYGNPYGEEEASKAWKKQLLERIAGVKCPELSPDDESILKLKLSDLQSQCQSEETSCRDINREERRDLEEFLRSKEEHGAADGISEDFLFFYFDMSTYKEDGKAPCITTGYGSWQLCY